MDTSAYFLSLSQELCALKNRIRCLAGNDTHWLTDGEWKETVLRIVLRRHLPKTIEVGRGFIVTPNKTSSQIDLLIYSSEVPVLFRDGDLVFVTPDAVKATIEIKSSVASPTALKKYAKKLASISDLLTPLGYRNWISGLFAYDSKITPQRALDSLHPACGNDADRAVNLVCLGSSHFIKWWSHDPDTGRSWPERWRSYRLTDRAAGYFIHSVIQVLCPKSVGQNSLLWFPIDGKEVICDGEKTLH